MCTDIAYYLSVILKKKKYNRDIPPSYNYVEAPINIILHMEACSAIISVLDRALPPFKININPLETMQIVYWPEELCKYLKERYQYDPETGWVTYRSTSEKRPGPMRTGPLGTKNPSGMILVVKFQHRQWTLSMGRLCAFLHTGKQYRKVDFADGNRLNYKIDNLVGIRELTEEPDDTKMLAAAVLANSKRLEEMAKAQQQRLVEMANVQAPRTKELVTDTVKTINIGYKTGEELWAEIAAEELEAQKCYQLSLFGHEHAVLTVNMERWLDQLVAEHGLFTGAQWYHVQDHYNYWHERLGFSLENYTVGQVAPVTEDDPKYVHDFYYACRLLKNLERGLMTNDQVDTLMTKYSWAGEAYPAKDFTSQVTEEYNRQLRHLELVHRTCQEAEYEYIRYCRHHGIQMLA